MLEIIDATPRILGVSHMRNHTGGVGGIGRPQALLVVIARIRILFSRLASDSTSETP